MDWRMSCSSSTMAIFIALAMARLLRCFCCFIQNGQLHLENGAAVLAIARGKAPAQIRNDARGNGEAEANTVAGLLCRVERLEERIEILDPITVDAHAQRGCLPRGKNDFHLRVVH